MTTPLHQIFPLTCQLADRPLPVLSPQEFVTHLQQQTRKHFAHPFLPELADLELAIHQLKEDSPALPDQPEQLIVNPSLRVFESGWFGLPEYFRDQTLFPEAGTSIILLFLAPEGERVVRTATSSDLLALKIVVEHLDSRDVARRHATTVGAIDRMLEAAAESGLLLAPRSRLNRDHSYSTLPSVEQSLLTTSTFTLQWHLTQACDLHCRHCYDRGRRDSMPLKQAVAVLDDLYDFTRSHHLSGQVSFSGGNPLLYPHFFQLYQEAAERGFQLAILGNPTSGENIDRLLAIERPIFYQVSLEGLRAHNDHIRGGGHFDRVLDFLDILRRRSIYSMVMLTLTRANADEVMPLVAELEGRVDLFTFNRLAMVGEGAALASLEVHRLPGFLRKYLAMAERKPFLSLKDNFFNLLQKEKGRPLTGGCTGFGCGAAFNFFALLPDGEVHACRKFPSPIGNISSQSLAEIYHGEPAVRYRSGPSDCLDCRLRPACKGCMAVAYGFGRDVFTECDPYCFIKNTEDETKPD